MPPTGPAVHTTGSEWRIEKGVAYSHLSSFVFLHISCQDPMAALMSSIILTPMMGVLTIKDPILDFVLLILPIPSFPHLIPPSPAPHFHHSSSYWKWLISAPDHSPYLPTVLQPVGTSVHPTLHEVVEHHKVEQNPRRAKNTQKRWAAMVCKLRLLLPGGGGRRVLKGILPLALHMATLALSLSMPPSSQDTTPVVVKWQLG